MNFEFSFPLLEMVSLELSADQSMLMYIFREAGLICLCFLISPSVMWSWFIFLHCLCMRASYLCIENIMILLSVFKKSIVISDRFQTKSSQFSGNLLFTSSFFGFTNYKCLYHSVCFPIIGSRDILPFVDFADYLWLAVPRANIIEWMSCIIINPSITEHKN